MKRYQVLLFVLISIRLFKFSFSSSSHLLSRYSIDDEFSKDIALLAVESTLKSKCPGTIFLITSECEDHFHRVGEELSFWSNPIVIINYSKSSFLESLTNSFIQKEKWSFFLQSKISPSSNFIFVCDLINMDISPKRGKESNESIHVENPKLDLSIFPKPIVRSVDQILYFDGSFSQITSQRIFYTQLEILKYAEILMFITKNKSQVRVQNFTNLELAKGSIMSAYSSCLYCRPSRSTTNANNNANHRISNELLGLWQRNKTTIAKYFTIFKFQSNHTFHNYTFEIGYLNYKPHFSCVPKDNAGSSEIVCTGIEWEMLKKLSSQLKFLYELKNFSTNGGHGIVFSSENITGITGALVKKTLDFGIGGASVTAVRKNHIDFTKIFSSEAVVFVVAKRPEIYILGIWLAFQPTVWPILLLSIILFSILFKYVSNHRINFSYGLQFAVSTLLGQPLTNHLVTRPRRYLIKIFLATWWFMALIIGIFYNTSLITSLITPVIPREPETLAELIQQGYKFRLGNKNSVLHGMLQQFDEIHLDNENGESTYYHDKVVESLNEINSPFNLIRQRLVSGGTQEPLEQSESRSRKIVFVLEESTVEEIDWKNIYGFGRKRTIRERLLLTSNAWSIRAGAPFARKFDAKLTQLLSVGLVDYWQKENSLHVTPPVTSSKFRLQEKLRQIKMNLMVLHGAFLFFLIGCTLSAFVFSLEHLTHRYSFRFFTVQEIKERYQRLIQFWKRVNNVQIQRNIGKEIVRAGNNSVHIVVNPLIADSTQQDSRNRQVTNVTNTFHK